MNRPEMHDPIEQQLENVPAPPPPKGWEALAESIKAEIPAHLELAPELSPEVSGTPRRHLWLAAASVVMALAAGWVGLQVFEDNPQPKLSVESAPPERAEAEVSETEIEAEAARPLTGPVPDPTPVASELDDSVEVTAEAPVFEERRVSRGTTVSDLESLGYLADAGALENVPTARDPWPLSSQAPGVTTDRIEVEPTLQAPPPPPSAAVPAPRRAQQESRQRLEREMHEMEEVVIAPAPHPGAAPPSTGGTAEPNDQPYGDVFFEDHGTNPFVDTDEDRLSTFGLDVDTGSWNVARRYMADGNLPPAAAVRIEEWVNAFDYDDPTPSGRGEDFRLTAQGSPTPFGGSDRHRVLRFAVQAREVLATERPATDLTFVVDVSGSMAQENRLGLVRRSLQLLTDQLRPDDRVALVVYGSDARLILPHTGDKAAVREAIGRLQPEGSTNAEAGLRLAYRLAASVARPGVTNRVILCSDGVANVGATGPDSILQVIERAAKSADGGGIELLTVGFGMGNYNDVLMEQLANRGDGRYAYVDTFDEARRLFVDELTGTLYTVASEARAQVAFDPSTVERWRLLGYENRDIADERFRDDTVDAGEIGAGHAVTALYEVKLAEDAPRNGTLARLTLRYRSELSAEMTERSVALRQSDLAGSFDSAPRSLRLATLVAETAELTKGTFWTRDDDPVDVARHARRLAAEPGVSRAWREGLDLLVELAEKVADQRREEARRR